MIQLKRKVKIAAAGIGIVSITVVVMVLLRPHLWNYIIETDDKNINHVCSLTADKSGSNQTYRVSGINFSKISTAFSGVESAFSFL